MAAPRENAVYAVNKGVFRAHVMVSQRAGFRTHALKRLCNSFNGRKITGKDMMVYTDESDLSSSDNNPPSKSRWAQNVFNLSTNIT